MNKQELYDYVMKSPYNTNPVILRQAIEGLSNNDSNNGGGGASSSGGKIAIFDLAKYDEYEKIELGPLQTMIKLSDEVPTYDELCGGLYLYCASVTLNGGTHLPGNAIWYLNDGNHLTGEAEAGVVMVEDHMMVLSATAAEIFASQMGVQVTPGIYSTFTGLNLSGATGTMYEVLAWGF